MILLTGATGYIASHTWLALHAAGYAVCGLDDFSNSSPEVLHRLEALGADVSRFMRADVCDRAALGAAFARWPIDAVVHFAALKAVGESVAKPLAYYATNVGGLIALTQAMADHGCRTIVFSSSATVYGVPERLPIREDSPLAATSPYGATKLVGEGLLNDLLRSDPLWRIALLRYFNPVGAHEGGSIGEDPRGAPNNLMPYVAQVAVGKRLKLQIFGNDYDTRDGTGVRDYLHVVDLAEGHVAALRRLLGGGESLTVNLGTGTGTSVLELLHAFERASGRTVAFEIAPRRAGDVASCYADPSQAELLLGWRARRNLDAMCADSWRWQTNNPNGYGD
ncbi:MAG: UDP-glucose 4-epimerase GalE [Caldimonas sp.]